MLKESFKYYKRKCPPPCLSDVINFSRINVADSRVTSDSLTNVVCREDIGLKPTREWKIFHLKDKPGFIFISNPFTPIGQRYWMYRCLRYYTQKPNRLNLDAHGDIQDHEDWWEKCQANHETDSMLLKKLRWATLGYHHNWDTKEYKESERDVFPEDLALLSHQIASAMGFKNFSAEAAIVNYYHMDSTLSCHTDHSELYLEAPLLSFRGPLSQFCTRAYEWPLVVATDGISLLFLYGFYSCEALSCGTESLIPRLSCVVWDICFGQSAIFLLGGKTKEEKPVAMLIHSGDIIIMSGDSRLCYHGVPSIIPATSCPWNIEHVEGAKLDLQKNVDTSLCVTHRGVCGLINSAFRECSCDELWEPFEKYISTSRINMNVRQVLPFGQATL